jgi:hypothetical protein
MKRPDTIRNEPKWIADCTKIRARACDLIEGRISLFVASQELNKLAIWTHAKDDADLSIFKIVYGEFVGIPVGPERTQWAPHALAREDLKIRNLEAIWRDKAIAAAKRLVERYAWSLEARAALRRTGGS